MLWLETLHSIFLTGLFSLGIIFIRCAIRANGVSKKLRALEPSKTKQWPAVTVQLPVRNERNVVERLLRAAVELDYPSDHLEIQVLDDSDDETSESLNVLVEKLRVPGNPTIEIVRRSRREGFKAGAMAHGLLDAKGEFIAIFDSDCIPASNFLKKVIPHFERDPRVGMVQARWTFVNRERSWLTRVQAMILDSLMLVEQPVHFDRSSPFQFNGSGGIWRRSCIESSGGWRAVSVAEDLDLSFRALLGGWCFVHLSGVAVDTELPEEVSSYRFQQKRWTCGSAQVLRELFSPILRSSRPAREIAAMFMHLGRRAIFPLLLAITVLAPLVVFGWVPVAVPFGLGLNLSVWAFFVTGFVATLVQGHRLLGKGVAEVLLLSPLVIGLFIGLSLTCSASFFFGLFKRNSRFVRTPKRGDASQLHFYRSEFDSFAVPEIAVGLGYLFFSFLALKRGMVFEPFFFAGFAISYLMVGASALHESFNWRALTKSTRAWFTAFGQPEFERDGALGSTSKVW